MKTLSVALLVAATSSAPFAVGDTAGIEEVIVSAKHERNTVELSDAPGMHPDTAQLLKGLPGVDVQRNGPITAMPQIRGMSRFRVATHIDGQTISPGGPNWMDAPLSYAPAATLERLSVHRGIAPVSAGQETIGGVIEAESWQGEFTDVPSWHGRARSGWRSESEATLLSATTIWSDERQRVRLSAMTEQADDYDFPGGTLSPSGYERERYDAGYMRRFGDHTIAFSYARVETGDAGTAALPMDIEYIDSDLASLRYTFAPDGVERASFSLYGSDIAHGMTNFHERTAPANPVMWRRNITDVINHGFSASLLLGEWKLGVDHHSEVHNSRISNPNNPMFFVSNFNDARRDATGVFAERTWLLPLPTEATLETGIRVNRITSDADPVNATPAIMGMPPAVALRDRFNGADRSRRDYNLDLAARLRVPLSDDLTLYVGAARKTRSPSYQERYLWLPLQATAGLADGRTYTGDVTLDPEVATEVELGVDFTSDRATVVPRIFYRHINDYITGVPTSNSFAAMFTNMMGNSPPLEFSNVDAKLWGFDVDWRVRLSDTWHLSGAVNVLRGEHRDTGDDLYRLPPTNARVTLAYERGRWNTSASMFAYDDQNNVSTTNSESKSDGYVIANIDASFRLTEHARVSIGIENLADVRYADHLSGVYRVNGNPDLARGERIPGEGRNTYVRLDVSW